MAVTMTIEDTSFENEAIMSVKKVISIEGIFPFYIFVFFIGCANSCDREEQKGIARVWGIAGQGFSVWKSISATSERNGNCRGSRNQLPMCRKNRKEMFPLKLPATYLWSIADASQAIFRSLRLYGNQLWIILCASEHFTTARAISELGEHRSALF